MEKQRKAIRCEHLIMHVQSRATGDEKSWMCIEERDAGMGKCIPNCIDINYKIFDIHRTFKSL